MFGKRVQPTGIEMAGVEDEAAALGPAPGLAPGRWGRALAAARGLLLDEVDRWVLWSPVAVALGVALYFAFDRPPRPAALWLVLALGALAAWLALRWRRPSPLQALVPAVLALVALGFVAAQWRTEHVGGRLLDRPGTYRIEGRILEAAPTAKGARLLLDRLSIERLPEARTPLRVRLSVRGGSELRAGQRVAALARLQPPSAPLLPGGFDFARQAWFQGVGAVGFALGTVEPREAPAEWSLAAATAGLRETIAERIVSRAQDSAGHMSAALLTGLQGGITDEVWDDMQRSGLAHLISISGLHMTMVAGFLFLALRYGLAAIPWLALRWPVKKLAAVGALLGVTFYLLISGMSVPAQRSWLMVALAFAAVLIDRNPLSPRVLAFAAFCVLLVRPESLTGPSFQLSFAAVLALIAAYEAGAGALTPDQERLGPGPLAVGLHYAIGIALTTVLASLATAPFSAWHFQSVASWSVLANVVAVPLSNFIVMPAGLVAVLLMPFGLEGPFVLVMVAGVEVVLATAHYVAELPYAALLVPQLPLLPLLLFAMGGLWLCLWTRLWRLAGLLPMGLAVVLAILAKPPDLVVGPTLDMAAIRSAAGGVRLLERDRDGFVRDAWLQGLGTSAAEPFPASAGGATDGLACDAVGCLLTSRGQRVALAFSIDAVLEDCRTADLVIAAVGPESCAGSARLIGPRALRSSDGLTVRLRPGGAVVETVASRRGLWPWTWAGNRATASGPPVTPRSDAAAADSPPAAPPLSAPE